MLGLKLINIIWDVLSGQGPKVEQFKLIGYTLCKYIWNKKQQEKASAKIQNW